MTTEITTQAHYEELLTQIGHLFGDDAFMKDNGDKSDSMILDNIPALVSRSLHYYRDKSKLAIEENLALREQVRDLRVANNRMLEEMHLQRSVGLEAMGKMQKHVALLEATATIYVQDNGLTMDECYELVAKLYDRIALDL
jgi:hypothetical protein